MKVTQIKHMAFAVRDVDAVAGRLQAAAGRAGGGAGQGVQQEPQPGRRLRPRRHRVPDHAVDGPRRPLCLLDRPARPRGAAPHLLCRGRHRRRAGRGAGQRRTAQGVRRLQGDRQPRPPGGLGRLPAKTRSAASRSNLCRSTRKAKAPPSRKACDAGAEEHLCSHLSFRKRRPRAPRWSPPRPPAPPPQGGPGSSTSAAVRAATADAVDRHQCDHYSRRPGIAPLCQAVAAHLTALGVPTQENDVVISGSGQEARYVALRALAVGKTVYVSAPEPQVYDAALHFAGATVVVLADGEGCRTRPAGCWWSSRPSPRRARWSRRAAAGRVGGRGRALRGGGRNGRAARTTIRRSRRCRGWRHARSPWAALTTLRAWAPGR